jgi:hypothetical protein
MECLKIITGFDGSAPFSSDGVNKEDNGTLEFQ